MEYTRESIYDEIGRYNATVIIGLKSDTEEFTKYGSEMIGTFLYSNRERVEMTKSNGQSKTHGKIRFKYNDEDKVIKEHIIELRRFGISTESISNLFFLYPPESKDAFIEEGIKEIPNVITIPNQIDSTNNLIGLVLGLYNNKRKKGWRFLDEEIAEFIGLVLLKVENCVQELLEEYEIDEKPHLIDRIDFYNLRARFWLKKDKMSVEDKKRLNEISSKYTWEVFCQFRNEFRLVMPNDIDFMSKYPELGAFAYLQSMKFKPERLVERHTAIWWNATKFAHIMFRHALEFDNEEDKRDKTRFQYKIPEAIRIIKIVCEMVYDEYIANGCKDFYLKSFRAVEYNGNHYCLRIDSTGLLHQFFPYKKEI